MILFNSKRDFYPLAKARRKNAQFAEKSYIITNHEMSYYKNISNYKSLQKSEI